MIKTSRKVELAGKILIVDGLPGCGKTMLSPIVGALDRVEKLTFAFEIENMCQLCVLGKLEPQAASTMIRIFTDMKLYNMMMGREVNFRIKDLSGVFMNGQPWRYVKRIFGPGDETVPARVLQERPILHLTTHKLLSYGRPVFEALKDRVVLIDVVRHPLYMVKQQALNMQRLIADVRYFNVHFEVGDKEIPYWAYGWEDIFLRSNDYERAVYSIIKAIEQTKLSYDSFPIEFKKNIITIPFENYVLAPDAYMDEITHKLGTQMTSETKAMMRRQKVPRKRIADGLDLPIYRRCGWKESKSGTDETGELEDRRNWVVGKISSEMMQQFDTCCKEYERTYMGGVHTIPGRT